MRGLTLLIFVAMLSMNANLCQHRDGVSAMGVSEILRSQKTPRVSTILRSQKTPRVSKILRSQKTPRVSEILRSQKTPRVSEILRSHKIQKSKRGWSVSHGGVRNGSVSDGGAGLHS